MNKITKEIYSLFLKYPAYWDKETGLLQVGKIRHDYTLMREHRWLEEIWYPKTRAFNWWVKAMDFLPTEWQQHEWDPGKYWWYPVELECQEWLEEMYEDYFNDIWYGLEWGYEEPILEELMALGIRPEGIAAQEILITGVEVKRPGSDWKPERPKPTKKPKFEEEPKQLGLL